MSASEIEPADQPSSAAHIQEMFAALVEELDRAIARMGDCPGDETWERLQNARAAAMKGLALSKELSGSR